MENKKKIWIVSEVFYPDETSSGYYLTEIAIHLSKYQEVNVICGNSSYEKQSNIVSNKKNLPKNINVFRVKTLPFDKNKLVSRVFGLLHLTFSFSFKLLLKVTKNDDVFLVTNPAFLVPITAIFAKIKRFNLRVLVHDVFPENLVPVNLINQHGWIYKLIGKIFNKAYSSSYQIIVCGRDMKVLFEEKVGKSKKEKIVVIENWADIDTIFPKKNQNREIYQNDKIKDKIIFQFAGNIGRLQGLEEFIDIIKKCINPHLHFVFIGEGALKNFLKEKVVSMSNVTFMPSLNRNQQDIFLNACDVGIVSLYDSMLGLGVPSKSYNIIAAGKPILFLGNKDSEISLMVREHNIGWQFELSQSNDIINFLNNFSLNQATDKGLNARHIAETKYSKERILEKYLHLLN